jgi:hypothetical protein
MRLVLVMVLAALVALPLSASAQAGEEGAIRERSVEEPAPQSQPAPEEPALQLQLDDAGVEVAPAPPRTADRYTLEEADLRVRRAAIGLGVSAVVFVAGGVMGAVALSNYTLSPTDPYWIGPVGWTGVGLMAAGGLGMIATSALLGVRKRELRRLQQAHYGTLRRVQWDLARSRLVF